MPTKAELEAQVHSLTQMLATSERRVADFEGDLWLEMQRRQDMHRRAQRAEGKLMRLEAKALSARRASDYWRDLAIRRKSLMGVLAEHIERTRGSILDPLRRFIAIGKEYP